MRLTFLGTGTSTGVPQIGCGCHVCRSSDARDKRLRASVLIEVNGRRLLIDCSADFRQQILAQGSPELDALLITHSHYDHVGGMDDLRPYCYREGGFDVWCRADVERDLRAHIPYCFVENPYPGVPHFHIHRVEDTKPFIPVPGVEVTPLPIMHTPRLPILGYRIGDLSYVTDCKIMPESTLELMRGTDTLVINALRSEPHNSHLSLSEALEVVRKVNPRRTFLTHMSHQIGTHEELSAMLPEGVAPAFDGLTIVI